MKRIRLSVESLETRETPASLASVTDLVIDSFNPAPSDSYYGRGVLKSTDGGQTWADSAGVSGRVTGIAVDPTDPSAAGRGGVIHVYVHVITNSSGTGANAADGEARYFNGFVTRTSAGADTDMALKGTNETKAIDAQTVDSARPTVLLQRLANPGLPATQSDGAAATQTGNVYTITFGGSLVG